MMPLLALVSTVGAATLVNTTPAQASLFGMSEQQEIEAGRQVAAQAEKQYGGVLPPNNPMTLRVRAIGAQLARLSSRKNIPFSYSVLNNDKILNAFATMPSWLTCWATKRAISKPSTS
jgi:predicted Zn-dependent protease